MFLILGEKGNLSRAIQKKLHNSEVLVLNRKQISTWIAPDGVHEIKTFIASLHDEPQGIFNAAGIIDPTKSPLDLEMVNFQLPRNLLEATNDLSIPLYTFGSIMERDQNCRVSNRYLSSKRKFKSYLDELDKLKKSFHLHFLVHTWYGVEKLPEHMFLGQIAKSLKEKKHFAMSSGTQMREYHHVEDDIEVVFDLIQHQQCGEIEINHGIPIELKNLAIAIYSHFNYMQYLSIDASVNQDDESRTSFYQGAVVNSRYRFREQKAGVIEYLEKLVT